VVRIGFPGYQAAQIGDTAIFSHPGRQIAKKREGLRRYARETQTVHIGEKARHLLVVGLPCKIEVLRQFHPGFCAVVPVEGFQRGSCGAKMVLAD
jgi:hypothetical protein